MNAGINQEFDANYQSHTINIKLIKNKLYKENTIETSVNLNK